MCEVTRGAGVIREFKQNSRGRRRQRRQNNKTNYTRQKVHVNMWNKRTFVPSCSRVRRQLLHFHVVCKTWSIFQELSPMFSFKKTLWRQLNLSENRNKQWNQSKYMLRKNTRIMSKYFYCLPTLPSSCRPLLKLPIIPTKARLGSQASTSRKPEPLAQAYLLAP